jgi:peptidyl-prolyl cis-trans isomerase SurA
MAFRFLLSIIPSIFGLVAYAQSPFSPAIIVNDKSITYYELSQRAMLLKILKVPGDISDLARKQLIEDRLKLAAAEDLGLLPAQDEIRLGMDEFSSRGGLDTATFIAEISQMGVSEQTFKDFVQSSIAWRSVVQARFGSRSQVPETQLERSTNSTGSGSGLRVLLTEIILAAPKGQKAQAQELAKELSKITSVDVFSQAARDYSAAPTRSLGGLVKWQDLDKLPDVLKPLIFGLAPGEVTEPLSIPNGIAIFQLRAIKETSFRRPTAARVDYLTYTFPLDEVATLAQLKTQSDHCDDLYSIAKQNPTHTFVRESNNPKAIKKSIRNILAILDAHEKYFNTKDNVSSLTMLCGRSAFVPEDAPDLQKIRFGLRNQRLESYAQGYLENMLQDARIIVK